MCPFKKSIWWITLLIAGLLIVRTSRAEEAVCEQSYRHILSGHVFLPSFTLPWPFADSQALVAVSGGHGNYTVPATLGGGELSLGAIAPIARGQVALLPGLAISFGIGGSVTAGLNTDSALRYGGSVTYTLNVAALYELIRSDQWVFSVGLRVDRPHAFSASPLDASQLALRDLVGSSDPDYISEKVNTQWRPSLMAAFAPHPVIGFRGRLGMSFSSTQVDDSDSLSRTRLLLGLIVDVDFLPAIRVPVGVTLAYSRGQSLTSGGSNTDSVTVGLYETLSTSFNVGIEGGFVNVGGVNTTLGAIAVRTYYN